MLDSINFSLYPVPETVRKLHNLLLWNSFSVNQTSDLPLSINCDVSSLVLKVNL